MCDRSVAGRWRHFQKVLKNSDGQEIPHPSEIPLSAWVDDSKLWPQVHYRNIFNYFVLAVGIDGEAMENYKGMESYQFFQALKVGTVLFHTPAPGMCFLKAEVIPSQSLHSTKHRAWVLVKDDGAIHTAGCSCIAGLGKTCSHAGAILWKLEYAASTGMSGLACTDQQQQWNKGTSCNVQPRSLQQISFKKKTKTSELKLLHDTAAATLPELPVYRTSVEFETAVTKSAVASKLFQFGMAAKVLSAKAGVPENCPDLDVQHSAHGTEDLICRPCSTFFNKYVLLSLEQRTALQNETQDQAGCDTWRDARRVRLTASSAKKVPVRAATDVNRFMREHLYPSFKGNAATWHGQQCEPLALAELTRQGYNIARQGAVVSATEPWLSASPDGVTADSTIEVKCPVLGEHDTFEQKLKSCDISTENGRHHLKENGARGYYLQVQLTMFCTGKQKCTFFVWSARGHMCIDVAYNEDYTRKAVNRLKKFYFLHLLPRLAKDFNEGRLRLCGGYKTLCCQ